MLIVLTFRLQYSTHGFLPGNVKVEWFIIFSSVGIDADPFLESPND